MLVLPELNDPEPQLRTHPWSKTEYEEKGGAYYDFKENPELIPEVLEDFIPHSKQPAVQRFYNLLAWLNGPDGLLETNDCALREPFDVSGEMFRKQRKIDGRLEFLFRDVHANLSRPSVSWLQNLFFIYAQTCHQQLYYCIVSVKIVPTRYLTAPESSNIGFRFRITYNAYGDSDMEAWSALDELFTQLHMVFFRLDAAMRVSLPEFP